MREGAHLPVGAEVTVGGLAGVAAAVRRRVRQVTVNGLVGARAESPVVPAIGAGGVRPVDVFGLDSRRQKDGVEVGERRRQFLAGRYRSEFITYLGIGDTGAVAGCRFAAVGGKALVSTNGVPAVTL